MYRKKEYRTLRMVANFTSGFGWVIVGVLVLFGFVLGLETKGFLAGLLMGIIMGVVIGIPFVVAGQTTSVFLDQKELLEEILDAVRKS